MKKSEKSADGMPNLKGKRVAISGAGGFLGGALSKRLGELGCSVAAFVRKPGSGRHALEKQYRLELPEPGDESAFAEPVDAFIHCAYDTRFKNQEQATRVNMEGTRYLLRLCREKNVGHFVFISSMSAHEDAVSFYGRSKFAIEKILDPRRDLIIRPGFIIGPGGIFQRLARTIASIPIVPVFYGSGRSIQTIHVDSLVDAILRGIDENICGVFNVSADEAVPLTIFYKAIARRMGVRRLMIPLPGTPFLYLFRLFESLRIPLPFSSENLLGLKALKVFDVADDLKTLNTRPSPMDVSLKAVDRRNVLRLESD